MNCCSTTESSPERFGRTWLAALAAAVVLLGVGIVWVSLPEPGTRSSPLPSSEEVGIDPKFGDIVPTNLVFRDEAGQPVEFGELFAGKPMVLAPVYLECPMLCNMTMDGLVRCMRGLSEDIGDEFSVVVLSFDPREGPQLAAAAKRTALQRYGREQTAGSWHFLTGDPEPIRQLTDAIGFRYKYDERLGQYAHAAGLFVLTPEGKISRFLSGVEFAPRDVKLATTEASEGRASSLTDQVLLLCFHYDPANGKYGLAIMRLVRFAGVLTVGLLVGGILLMIRSERTHGGRPTEWSDPPGEGSLE
jgi:protein SCO1/2